MEKSEYYFKQYQKFKNMTNIDQKTEEQTHTIDLVSQQKIIEIEEKLTKMQNQINELITVNKTKKEQFQDFGLIKKQQHQLGSKLVVINGAVCSMLSKWNRIEEGLRENETEETEEKEEKDEDGGTNKKAKGIFTLISCLTNKFDNI